VRTGPPRRFELFSSPSVENATGKDRKVPAKDHQTPDKETDWLGNCLATMGALLLVAPIILAYVLAVLCQHNGGLPLLPGVIGQ
jgi:hypothetical protein